MFQRFSILLVMGILPLLGLAQTYTWTWMHGSKKVRTMPHYGHPDSISANKTPGGRQNVISWTDTAGHLWIYGGIRFQNIVPLQWYYLNDLWKWDGEYWHWVSGDATVNSKGTYRKKGAPHSQNHPGCRASGGGWTDSLGNFWLFGGNMALNNTGRDIKVLNDLWKWDGKNWTWVRGSQRLGASGAYGQKGLANPNNTPGARSSFACWTDSLGNCWIFGGRGYDANGDYGPLSDLWRWDGSNWTWMGGSKTNSEPADYGTYRSPSPTNTPGGRYSAITCTDHHGNLWLLGGSASGSSSESRNDLWKWDGTNWTWMDGDTVENTKPHHGLRFLSDSLNDPGERHNGIIFFNRKQELMLFGSNSSHNDLWKWTEQDNWIWMKGDSTEYARANYGQLGVTNTSNTPGGRSGLAHWKDTSDRSWIFGGFGRIQSTWSSGNLSDIWLLDTTQSAPKMAVLAGKRPIAAGDTMPKTSTQTDFDSIKVKTLSRPHTFAITNQGLLELSLDSPYIALSGQNATDFRITAYPHSSLKLYDTSYFDIQFYPSGTGLRTAQVEIRSNDTSYPAYRFSIHGQGIAPLLEVKGNGNPINVGDSTPSASDFTLFDTLTIAKSPLTRTFILKNLGKPYLLFADTPFTFSGKDQASFTAKLSASDSLAPNEETQLYITFAPVAEGEQTATIHLHTNNYENTVYSFKVMGYGKVPLGAKHNGSKQFARVYPNPSTGFIYINTSDHSMKKIEVLDLTGKLIKSVTSTGKNIQLNLSDIAKGVYVIKTQTADYSCAHQVVIE